MTMIVNVPDIRRKCENISLISAYKEKHFFLLQFSCLKITITLYPPQTSPWAYH